MWNGINANDILKIWFLPDRKKKDVTVSKGKRLWRFTERLWRFTERLWRFTEMFLFVLKTTQNYGMYLTRKYSFLM